MAHKLAHSPRTRTDATRQHSLLKRGIAAGRDKKVQWRDVLAAAASRVEVVALQRALRRLEHLGLLIVRRSDGLHIESYELTRPGRQHARGLTRGDKDDADAAKLRKTPPDLEGVKQVHDDAGRAAFDDVEFIWRLRDALGDRVGDGSHRSLPDDASDQEVLVEGAFRLWSLAVTKYLHRYLRKNSPGGDEVREGQPQATE